MAVVALSCVHRVVWAQVGVSGCGWTWLKKDAMDRPSLDGLVWYQLIIFLIKVRTPGML